MYRYILAAILLAGLCLSMACTDKSTEPSGTTVAVDTVVVKDIDYAARIRYDLGRLPLRRAASDTLMEPDKYDFIAPGDSIIRLIVFQDDNASGPIDTLLRFRADCFIDPDDTLSDDTMQIYRTTGYFEVVGTEYYYFDPVKYNMLFLNHYVGEDDIIAVYMEVLRRRDKASYVDTIGDISDLPLRLKLIKPSQYLDVNHHVWEYEWRNIYTGINRNWNLENVDIEIYRGQPIDYHQINPDDLYYSAEGFKYIGILGLDQGDNLGQGVPDGEVDRYKYVDQSLGRIILPDRHPFNTDSIYATDGNGLPIVLNDTVPEIYLDPDQQDLTAASKYYLVYFYRHQ